MTISADLHARLQRLRILVMDVDGVLTDGSIVLDYQGREIKRFNARDGHGLKLLRQAGIQTAIITSRSSEAVAQRARELGLDHLYQGSHDKRLAYAELKRSTGLDDAQVAYIGDDILDLPVMIQVGLAVAPGDAHPEVLERAHYVTAESGGRGAVRALAELILKTQGHWPDIMAGYLSR